MTEDIKKTARILIVDDTPQNLKLLESMLSQDGYQVFAMPSGEMALRAVDKQPPDLILLDVMMPGMDGFEVARRLKSQDESRDIPIVMVTALNDVESRVKALEAGADDFLTKPIDQTVLQARVKSSLEIKQLRDREKIHLDMIEKEKEKSEQLLLNILPQNIIEQLKGQRDVIAESHPDATVMFADIVGFTEMSSKITASEVLTLLNEIFSVFDALVEKHGLEKIKTIGDAYMVVGGVSSPRDNHPQAMANMALDMLQKIGAFNRPNGHPIQLRIGMHTGPVMAGVIGTKKFIFDIWGDTVNTASRMESYGVPGSIQVSAETYHRLHQYFAFEKRGLIHIKGKGEMATYYLLGHKRDTTSLADEPSSIDSEKANLNLARASEEMKSLTLTDYVTGLHTRPSFLALSQQQLATAVREKRKVLLLLVSLENHQTIVKRSGEEAGDQALKETAGLLIKTFRTSDIIGRIADNLFIVSGIEVTEVDDDILGQRVRRAIDANTTDSVDLCMAGTRWDPESDQSFQDVIRELEGRLRTGH